MCGKLEFWMYIMRLAAQAWEEYYVGRMEEVGFKRGVGNEVVVKQATFTSMEGFVEFHPAAKQYDPIWTELLRVTQCCRAYVVRA